MDYIGDIVSQPDSQEISRERWIALIRDHSCLVPPEPREGINPFTKKATTFRPPPDAARVVIAEKEVGSMSWAQDGSNLVCVFGVPELVVPLACEIAESLGGRFEQKGAI
jgi:hypothetical protein